jgi:gluconolactonase
MKSLYAIKIGLSPEPLSLSIELNHGSSKEARMLKVIQSYDARMAAIARPNTVLDRVADGAVWGEGPVYFAEDDSVVWSDAHGDRLLRWSARGGVEVLRQPSHYQSGNYRDLEGRLVSCSSGERAIIRREHDGVWRILADRYRGKRFNSPNDLVVKRDGTIWFTDPPYGLTQPNQGYGGEQEQPGCFVYRFNPETNEVDAMVTDMVRPNGLAFSPDEHLLYVSDTAAFDIPQAPHHIRVYEVMGDGYLANGRVFAVIDPGQPDGLRVDALGNVFTSTEDSVQVYAPDGTRLGKILVPEVCSNLTFGGMRGNRLFITAGQSLYAVDLNTHGAQYIFDHPHSAQKQEDQ